MPLLALFLIFITCLVTWGFGLMPTAQPLRDVTMMVVKLAAFVLLPWLLFRQPLQARMNHGDLTITIVMALVLILFQAAFGQGFARIHEAGMPAARLTISFLFAFVWLALEAGLVEEYTFRAVLQTRLENALGTKTGGIVVAALLFGLIHAPGLYLRAAHTGEDFGSAPSLLTAIGYSIVILSPTGFFLGVLWSRTKNLAIVVLVHAATDLIPNVVELSKHFRIG